MPFKEDIFALCLDVAKDVDGWKFLSTGAFKLEGVQHTNVTICPGFSFYGGSAESCVVDPAVLVDNKKVRKLAKQICGYDALTSMIKFVFELDGYSSSNPNRVSSIWRRRHEYFRDSHGVQQPWPQGWIGIENAEVYLRHVIEDGQRIVQKYFDLRSEVALLANLPIGYRGRRSDHQMALVATRFGVMYCMAAILRGDFGLVESYASGVLFPEAPRSDEDMSKILSVVPEFKRRLAKTGSVLKPSKDK